MDSHYDFFFLFERNSLIMSDFFNNDF